MSPSHDSSAKPALRSGLVDAIRIATHEGDMSPFEKNRINREVNALVEQVALDLNPPSNGIEVRFYQTYHELMRETGILAREIVGKLPERR